MTRLLLPLLLLAVLLGGCGGEPESSRLRFGLANAPANLDPRHATDATSERVNRLLYTPLVELDEAARPVAAMARWERLAPRHYRFTLDPQRASFDGGRQPESRDVVATYRSLLDPATASPHRAALALIERVEAVDNERIDIYTTRADPLLPAYLTIGILPARLIESGHDFRREPVGSGPFRLAAWPEEGVVRLQRRHDGFEVELVRVKDPTVRVLKLLRGEIDLLQNDLPPELIGYLEAEQGVRVGRRPGSNFSYIGLNLEDPLIATPELRRALAHAIDREAIINALFGGGARSAEALLPPGHWAGLDSGEPYPHDPPRARRLLESLGYGEGHPLKLLYKGSSDPFRLRVATLLQHQLQQVGIEMEIRSYDWSTFFGDVKAGNFQLYSLTWVGIKTPDIFRYAFHSSSLPPAGANRGRLRSGEIDRLIEAAERGGTMAEQAEGYRQLQRRLLQELPYIPLWYEDQVVASRARVAGYRLAADGNYDGLTTVLLQPTGR